VYIQCKEVKKLDYKPRVYLLTYWTGTKQHDEGYFKTRKITLFPNEIMKIVNERNYFVSLVTDDGLKFFIRRDNIIEIQELGEEKEHEQTTKA